MQTTPKSSSPVTRAISNAYLSARAAAAMARVWGMNVANHARIIDGKKPVFTESDYFNLAEQLETLSDKHFNGDCPTGYCQRK